MYSMKPIFQNVILKNWLHAVHTGDINQNTKEEEEDIDEEGCMAQKDIDVPTSNQVQL